MHLVLKESKMHYFQQNIGDYAVATRHLNNTEDLAYRRMMDLYYDKESPLTLDLNKLSRLIRMQDNKEEIKTVLEDFFVETEQGYTQSRIEKEIANYRDKAEQARKNGKKGGRPPKQPPKPKPPKKEDESQIMAYMPLTGDKTFELRQSQTDKWSVLYPSVDLGQEVNKMIGWLDANPSKRKTKAGIVKFMNTWLSKAQDSGQQYKPQAAAIEHRTQAEVDQFTAELNDQYERSQASKARLEARGNL